MTEFKVSSLFAGVGGICLGFQQAKKDNCGYKLVLANEIDKYASATYRHNFKHTLIEDDITKIFPSHLDKKCDEPKYDDLRKEMTSEYIDVLTAGFPCQAFSIAGRPLGFDDHRGNLFLNILEYVKALRDSVGKPRVLFLENVRNLKAHDKGNTYEVIKKEIRVMGYHIKDAVINTFKYTSTPQNRERIFIICFANERDANNFTMFDRLDEYRNERTEDELVEEISTLLSSNAQDKYYYTHEKYPHYFKQGHDEINLTRAIIEQNKFYQLRRGLYVRKNKSHVCPTLTANMGTGGHNVPLILDDKGIRKLTPSETFLLQGFPIGHGYELPTVLDGRKISDSRLYKQAGNSVSVPVIKLIATEILRIL